MVKILELLETNFSTALIKMFKTIKKIDKMMNFTRDMTSKNKADEYFCTISKISETKYLIDMCNSRKEK